MQTREIQSFENVVTVEGFSRESHWMRVTRREVVGMGSKLPPPKKYGLMIRDYFHHRFPLIRPYYIFRGWFLGQKRGIGGGTVPLNFPMILKEGKVNHQLSLGEGGGHSTSVFVMGVFLGSKWIMTISSLVRMMNLHWGYPPMELTYPTWGKGNSSSKCHFWGIC